LFNSQLNTIIIPSQKATPMNIRGVLFNIVVYANHLCKLRIFPNIEGYTTQVNKLIQNFPLKPL
jgi:hypothetical protein